MPGLTTAFAQGVAASRPAAATSNAGYVYFATDTGILSQSTGSSWTTIGPAVALDALTSKADLLTRTSSAYSRLGVGSNDQVLTADSTASTGLKWATPTTGFADPLTTRGDLIVRGGSGTTRLAVGSSGQYLKSDGTDATWAAAAAAGLYSAYLCYQDQQSSGTDGGTFTSGSWQTRVLNTEVADTAGHGTLASNQVTLDAGTYRVQAYCPGYQCGENQARLQNITDSATLVTGQSAYAASAATALSHALLVGRFTLASAKVIELQHRCASTHSSNGLGASNTFGTQIYASLELWKE